VDYLEFNPIQKLSLGKNIESLSGVVMIKNLEAATPFSWGVRGGILLMSIPTLVSINLSRASGQVRPMWKNRSPSPSLPYTQETVPPYCGEKCRNPLKIRKAATPFLSARLLSPRCGAKPLKG
jgi:hypothetical protein